ncbi:MAG: hypothetical protein U5K00_22770 [Melioribacteraceae bacterium]|nr:hypothetical protein [Melioribacteraceae bacterium]
MPLLVVLYVESGIPIVVAMDDRDRGTGAHAHALLCVGREKFKTNMLKGLKKNNGIYGLDEVEKKFVFIDDNHSPYQLATLSNPRRQLLDKSWHNCRINSFIAPLYPKIYLDAFKAKNCAIALLNNLRAPFNFDDIYMRFFLASSRSYKNYLALNRELNDEIKNLFIDEPMPKFIWVGELLSKDTISDEECIGLIALAMQQKVIIGTLNRLFLLYIKIYTLLKGCKLT